MFRQEGIRMPQPVISNYNEEKKLIIIGGHFMTSKYGINDIVEMKNHMHVEQIVLRLLEWVLIFVLNVNIVSAVL